MKIRYNALLYVKIIVRGYGTVHKKVERKYYMNAEQYKRANGISYNVCVIILACGLAMTIFNAFTDGSGFSGGKIAIIIATVIGGAIISTGYFKFSAVKRGSVMIMGGATIFYFVLLIAEDNIVYFAFGLPILICSIIYLNVKLCKFGIGAIIISFMMKNIQ